MKPLLGATATAIPVEASDEQLVEWAQAGHSEAFAVLFRRYRPAVARYAGRIVGDDVRAEDIVQEVFLSALRSIATLDRPAGFKPWLYRIAHNTCVDHVRRTRRGEEVSIDASLLPASEEVRLFRQAPSTHTAVTLKEDLESLREAFGGLPPAQSEVLVMRELQGLSYDEIALRLGVTRASVESTLFRARQGLRSEYGQIVTGERCLRMRPVMARMAEGMGGLRDRRALGRHVRGCQSCRREAYAMGIAGAALDAAGLRGGLQRVAALLPLPWLVNRRAYETDVASSAGGGSSSFAVHAHTAVAQLSASVGVSADQAATAIHKAVAVVAAVAVVGGSGLVATKSTVDPATPRVAPPAREAPATTVSRPLPPVKDGAQVAAPVAPPAAPATPPAAPAQLLPTAPSGVPGPIQTLGVPAAVAAPSDPPRAKVPPPVEVQTSAPTADPGPAAAGADAPVPAEPTGGEGGDVSGAQVGDGTPTGDAGGGPPPDAVPAPPDVAEPPPCDPAVDPDGCPALGSATEQASDQVELAG